MKISELAAWLADEISNANEDAHTSHKQAMNSYGAGYDKGFADALERVRLYLIGQLDT